MMSTQQQQQQSSSEHCVGTADDGDRDDIVEDNAEVRHADDRLEAAGATTGRSSSLNYDGTRCCRSCHRRTPKSIIIDALLNVWEDLQQHRLRRLGQQDQRVLRSDDEDENAERSTTAATNHHQRRRSRRQNSTETATRASIETTTTLLNPAIALLFGQFVAFVATSQNAASFTLEQKYNGVFPFFLMLPTYVCLSLHLLPCIHNNGDTNKIVANNSIIIGDDDDDDDDDDDAERSESSSATTTVTSSKPHRFLGGMIQLRTPWWYYLCLSILDLSPNYLTLQAMNLTTLTSATLLGSLTIPSTMLFCRLMLSKRYNFFHFVGVACVMVGGILTILTDQQRSNNKNSSSSSDDDDGYNTHPYSYVGDILAVLAALGYGIGDAAAEFWSKHIDRSEYLGMIGLFGSFFTALLFLSLELPHVTTFFRRPSYELLPALGVFVWYTISLVAYYINESLFLKGSDATLLNLSLQSSQFYAILFSVLAFHEQPPATFYFAVTFVVLGVFVYELRGNAGKTPALSHTSSRPSILSSEVSPILEHRLSSSSSRTIFENFESIETTSLVQIPTQSLE
jgi:solute carrier family 35 protein F1/2